MAFTLIVATDASVSEMLVENMDVFELAFEIACQQATFPNASVYVKDRHEIDPEHCDENWFLWNA